MPLSYPLRPARQRAQPIKGRIAEGEQEIRLTIRRGGLEPRQCFIRAAGKRAEQGHAALRRAATERLGPPRVDAPLQKRRDGLARGPCDDRRARSRLRRVEALEGRGFPPGSGPIALLHIYKEGEVVDSDLPIAIRPIVQRSERLGVRELLERRVVLSRAIVQD